MLNIGRYIAITMKPTMPPTKTIISGSIAAPLKDSPIFPPMVAQMIAVGEETGNLDTMLSKVADFYEDEVATAVKGLTSLLEPLMIIVVGGIVGFIVISMYMPLFKVYDAIR